MDKALDNLALRLKTFLKDFKIRTVMVIVYFGLTKKVSLPLENYFQS